MEYCLSIAERNTERACRLIEGEPLVELRADLMGLSAEGLGGLIGIAQREIVTCHQEDSAEIYRKAIECGAWGVDIDLKAACSKAMESLLEAARTKGTRLILSRHYNHTPTLEELLRVAKEAVAKGADIVKIVTTATTTAEALVPLKLYDHLPAERLVAFAMGPKGAFSRRLSLLRGAPYTYVAPDHGTVTAAGQPTKAEFTTLMKEGFGLDELTLPTSVTPPCSKSEAQRAILAAALSKGTSIIYNAHACDDTTSALLLAKALGAKVSRRATRLAIEGVGHEAISERLGTEITVLNVGESALLARLIIPLVATLLRSGKVCIEGRGTLLGRSLKESITLLEGYGASIAHNDYHLPLCIERSATLPCEMEIEGVGSSQIISGLMMASPLIDRDEMTHILVHDAVSRPYIGLTAEIMEQFGAIVTLRQEEPLRIDIEPEPYTPTKIRLHSDWSSASYFAAAYAIAQSGHQRAERYTLEAHIGTTQADEVFLMLLDTMGARLEVSTKSVEFLPSERLSAISYDATHTPDLIPTLAIVALFAEGESVIGGVERLENKESDRLESLVENLVAIGADIHIEEGKLHIRGGRPLKAAPIRTHNDHRIAMAFAVAALFMEQRPRLDNQECVAKSFPTFFKILNSTK